ncbi:MAG: M20 family metallopeptidase [Verrucomicrobia bacterium]|nr:M20 family metallopeptidase [Verrucomicrobiota bacterium]
MKTAASDVFELHRALVRIPSVNPAGDPGTDLANTGEGRLAEFLADRLAPLGAQEVTLTEVLPGRPNLLARFPSDRPGKPRLLFAPHTDTVSVAGMTIDPFAAEARDGKIHGRGACDTKGTIAAMLGAFAELRDTLPRLSHEIWFAGLMGEEAGNEGAHALAASGFRADFALVGEPTGCDIVHAHKGVAWLALTTRGRAAHGAYPERGVSAIYQMADVLRYVRDELAAEFAAAPDPVLGPASANVGLVRGGSKINIVPEHCTAELDLRTIPAQRRPDFIKEITARLRRACPDLAVELIRASPPLSTPADHPLVRALQTAGGKLVGAAYFTDGSVLADEANIPSVAAGPGDIAQAHTADEYIEADELPRGVEFYKRFLTAT